MDLALPILISVLPRLRPLLTSRGVVLQLQVFRACRRLELRVDEHLAVHKAVLFDLACRISPITALSLSTYNEERPGDN